MIVFFIEHDLAGEWVPIYIGTSSQDACEAIDNTNKQGKIRGSIWKDGKYYASINFDA